MKPETMSMLENWKKEVLKPIQGLIITRDYNPNDNGTIDLLWFANYQIEGVEHVFSLEVKNLSDDIDYLNIQIDNIEQNQLKKRLIG